MLVDDPGHPLYGIRAVYFDLDDTLCAYWDAAKIALRTAFQAHGPDGVSPEEMIGFWAAAFRDFCPNLRELGFYEKYLQTGEPTRTEQMRRALLLAGCDDPERAKRLSQTYAEVRDRSLRLFPEVLELLERLHGRLKMGMITNGPADIQRQEVVTLGLERFFDPILIEGEMGKGKPHPEVFELARRSAGCEPHELLFVGNSYRHDIAPAIEHGWRTYWVRRPSDVAPSATGPEDAPEGAPRPDFEADSLTPLMPPA